MRKLSVALFLLVLSQVCAYSQEKTEFGKVTPYDFVREYDIKDKNAPAVVVYESGRYSFAVEDSGNYIYNRFHRDVYIRIHILKQAGIDYADFEIPYYSSSDDVDKLSIEGYTYNISENKTVEKTPLSDKNILDEKVSDNVYVKKIAMPNVREGSIIELHYKHGSLYFDMPVWEFQKAIPVLYSELLYEESPYRRYALIFKGAENFDVYEVDDEHTIPGAAYASAQTRNIYTYGMKNLEAFKNESFLRNAIDFHVAIYPQLASRIDLRTNNVINYISSWPIMRKDLLSDSDFGRYIKSAAKETKEAVADLNLMNYDEAGKIEAIVRYVKNNYTWDGVGGKFASKKLSAFLKEKTGNAGNINLFLAGMLSEAGIESYPVILRTKPDGTINRSYPFVNFFNFVVVQAKAGDKTYYLDATDTYTPFDMVSLDCINTEGLVLKPKTEEWVMITNPHLSVSHAKMTLTIDSDTGILSGDVAQSCSGLEAVRQKKRYGGDQENLEEMFKGANFILKEVAAENYNYNERPFQIKYKFETEPDDPQSDKIFIAPLSHLAPNDNIFKETQRRYPIDLVSPATYSYNVSMVIPEGYVVEYLPKFQKIDNREISMIYAATVNGNTININAQFAFKSALYPYSDYNLLKKYYGDMITAFSENIILSKQE